MLNIVPFGAAVLEKKIFKHFPMVFITYVKVIKALGAGPFVTPGASFEQT